MRQLTRYQRQQLKIKLACLVGGYFHETQIEFKRFIDGHASVLQLGFFDLMRIPSNDGTLDFFHHIFKQERLRSYNEKNKVRINQTSYSELQKYGSIFAIPISKPRV